MAPCSKSPHTDTILGGPTHPEEHVRRLSRFTLIGGLAVLVALLGSVASVLDLQGLALVAGNLALALTAGLIVLADRRRGRQASRDRKALESSINRLALQAERVERKVDMVQRRVVSSLEVARLEEADRVRTSESSR